MNHVVNLAGSSIVTGKIKSVRNFTFLNREKEEIPIYYIDVETLIQSCYVSNTSS